MRKVFKPSNIIKSDRVVRIPDIEFKQEQVTEEETGEPTILTEEVYENIKDQMR